MKIIILLFISFFMNSCSTNLTSEYNQNYNKCFNYCAAQNTFVWQFKNDNDCLCYEGR